MIALSKALNCLKTKKEESFSIKSFLFSVFYIALSMAINCLKTKVSILFCRINIKMKKEESSLRLEHKYFIANALGKALNCLNKRKGKSFFLTVQPNSKVLSMTLNCYTLKRYQGF